MYTVVIVEDNRATADMLATAIDWNCVNCEVTGVAYNGQRGRMLILQSKPDIIISDIRMPGMDGMTMVETIQAVSPGSKVIYISAYNDFEYAAHRAAHHRGKRAAAGDRNGGLRIP